MSIKKLKKELKKYDFFPIYNISDFYLAKRNYERSKKIKQDNKNRKQRVEYQEQSISNSGGKPNKYLEPHSAGSDKTCGTSNICQKITDKCFLIKNKGLNRGYPQMGIGPQQ